MEGRIEMEIEQSLGLLNDVRTSLGVGSLGRMKTGDGGQIAGSILCGCRL